MFTVSVRFNRVSVRFNRVRVRALKQSIVPCKLLISASGITVFVGGNITDATQGRRSGYESGGDGIHVNPERSFGGTNGEPPSEASQLRKGGPGDLPRKISKTYMANGAIYVIPELYL